MSGKWWGPTFRAILNSYGGGHPGTGKAQSRTKGKTCFPFDLHALFMPEYLILKGLRSSSADK
jgi:hypothetical protein